MADEGLLTGNRKGFKERGKLPPVARARDRRPRRGRRAGRRARRLGRRRGRAPARPGAGRARSAGRRRGRARPGRPHPGAHHPPRRQGRRRLPLRGRADQAPAAREAAPARHLPHARRGGGGLIDPVDRKELKEWPIAAGEEGDAKDGDLVRFELNRHARFGVPQARVVETLGNPQDQRKISLIAVHAHGIPDEFPQAVLAEAPEARAAAARTAASTCATSSLLTIDPVDARDHDDAVHAAPDDDPSNAGGCDRARRHRRRRPLRAPRHAAWIARRASAATRSTSPTASCRCCPSASPTTCARCASARSGPASPSRMVFDKHGNKRSHTFLRALMRSAAKLSYQEAQAAIDGKPSARGRAAAGDRAAAAVGRLPGARRRPRPARAARPRPARAQDRARRRGPVERVVDARAAARRTG